MNKLAEKLELFSLMCDLADIAAEHSETLQFVVVRNGKMIMMDEFELSKSGLTADHEAVRYETSGHGGGLY